MAHHFFAYFQCAPSLDAHTLPPVEVVVPTGAAGNLAGKETLGSKWTSQKAFSPSGCLLSTNMEQKKVVFYSKEDRKPHGMDAFKLAEAGSRTFQGPAGEPWEVSAACETTVNRQKSNPSYQT